MSGLIKGIGKVFKKIGKFIKKNWKYIAMAVAVYFTAGIALSYFGATAGFAAAMPGFGAGGMFTSAATAIGFNGPAIAGAAMAAAPAGMGSAAALASFGEAAAAAGMTSAELAAAQAAGSVAWSTGAAGQAVATIAPEVGTGVGMQVGGAVGASPIAGEATAGETIAGIMNPNAVGTLSSPATTATATAPIGGGSGMSAVDQALIKSMQTTTKLGIATTALNVASGLMKPEEKDPIAFGVNRKGNSKYGWGTQGSDAFANMNKRATQPVGSQYAKEGGGTQFLSNPFDAGEQDYDPQVAREFIAQNAG